MSNSKNETSNHEPALTGVQPVDELNLQQNLEEPMTDEFCYFHHKGLYHASWQFLHTDGRWWGKSEFGPNWHEKVRWHPNLKFRAKINRLFHWDLIVETDMKPGQVLAIWGTVFETAWNVTSKESFMEKIQNAKVVEVTE
jgi:hypothetical protein